MTMSLSNDVILYHITKFVNDEATFSKLLRLNKFIYKKSDEVLYYGMFNVGNFSLLRKISVKKQITNIKIPIATKTPKYLHLMDYTNLRKINIDKPSCYFWQCDDMDIKLPKLVEKLETRGIAVNILNIDEVTNVTSLYCKNSGRQRSETINMFPNLKHLVIDRYVELFDISKLINLEVFQVTRSLTYKIIFPKNIREIYIKTLYNKYYPVDISLKGCDQLEVLCCEWYELPLESDNKCSFKDLPKSLKVIVFDGQIEIPKKKDYLLISACTMADYDHSEIDASFKVVPDKGREYGYKLRKMGYYIISPDNSMYNPYKIICKRHVDKYKSLKKLKKYKLLKDNNVYDIVEHAVKTL